MLVIPSKTKSVPRSLSEAEVWEIEDEKVNEQKKTKRTMKKTTIIAISIFAIFVLIASSCASRRQFSHTTRPEINVQQIIEYADSVLLNYADLVFPLHKIRGYTDSMLVAKYRNVDLESFRQLERLHRIGQMPNPPSNELAAERERQVLVVRERQRYPESQVRDIEQALRRLSVVYFERNQTALSEGHLVGNERHFNQYSLRTFSISHYKQVGDGFLVKGWNHRRSFFGCPCFITRYYGIFLVGYDHNIVEIKRWEIDPCPNKPYAEINIKIHYPEFESADVRLPELVGHSLDSLIVANIRYPALALEMHIDGTVLVSFIVDADGKASDAEVVRGRDVYGCVYGWWLGLEREVVRTVHASATGNNRQWIPGMKNGEKIPMEIQVEVEFGAIQWEDYARRRRRIPPSHENIRVSIVSNRNNGNSTSASLSVRVVYVP